MIFAFGMFIYIFFFLNIITFFLMRKSIGSMGFSSPIKEIKLSRPTTATCKTLTLEEFLSTPVNIDTVNDPIKINHKPVKTKPSRMLEIPPRPVTTNTTLIGPNLIMHQAKAYDVIHRQDTQKKRKNFEKHWKEEDDFRNWKSQKMQKRLYGARKQYGSWNKDNGLIEKIALERYEFYKMHPGNQFLEAFPNNEPLAPSRKIEESISSNFN